MALNNLARMLEVQGELPAARKTHEQSLAMQYALRGREAAPPAIAASLNNLATVLEAQGKLPAAHERHEQALAMRYALHGREAAHPEIAASLGNLAKMSEAAEALPLYEESLRIREELRDTWGIAGSHRAIAAILVKRGDVDEATAHLAKAIPGFVQVQDQLGVAESLETLGLVWHASGVLFYLSCALVSPFEGTAHTNYFCSTRHHVV